MKAVKRWVWNIFCALSLLIFATSVTLWVRSYFVRDVNYRIWRPTSGRIESYETDCSRGAMQFAHTGSKDDGQTNFAGGWKHERVPMLVTLDLESELACPNHLHLPGFQFVLVRENKLIQQGSGWGVQFPLRLFLIFAIPPVLWWRKWKKNRGRGFPVGVASAVEESRDREVCQDAKTAAKG